MTTPRDIFITRRDLERLENLIEVMGKRDTGSRPYIEELEEELERAHVVEADQIPPDVITMNSRVRLEDLNSREELTYTLAFPGSADAGENVISVLAPIGTALLGYRENAVIEWPVPAGTRRLKVLEVVYQPERSGHHHL
jgi:regulator of nucleoside diphosphate kinase